MRLLFVTVRSDFGGGPRHVNQLLDSLPGEYEIFMAYPENGEPYAEMWKRKKRVKGTLFIPYRKFSLVALWQLYRFIRKNGIDIVHSHGYGAGLYSRLLKLLGVKVKVVHTFHGISDEYSSKIKSLVSIFIGRSLKPFVNVYVAVSNGEKSLGLKRGFISDKKCIVIYNGVEDNGLRNGLSEKKTIVTLSRYDYQKNMMLCLEIARIMKNDGVQFVWIGDGENFCSLKEIVEREHLPVDMVGFQTHPISFLKNAGVYLSTSRFEGLPYALIEAASVGLPIVATDVKGNNEVAINKENGLTFLKAEDGVVALRKILNDDVLYKQLSENSRKLYEKKFSISVMLENLMALYQSLA